MGQGAPLAAVLGLTASGIVAIVASLSMTPGREGLLADMERSHRSRGREARVERALVEVRETLDILRRRQRETCGRATSSSTRPMTLEKTDEYISRFTDGKAGDEIKQPLRNWSDQCRTKVDAPLPELTSSESVPIYAELDEYASIVCEDDWNLAFEKKCLTFTTSSRWADAVVEYLLAMSAPFRVDPGSVETLQNRAAAAAKDLRDLGERFRTESEQEVEILEEDVARFLKNVRVGREKERIHTHVKNDLVIWDNARDVLTRIVREVISDA